MEQARHCSCWNQTSARLRRPGGSSSARRQAAVSEHHHRKVLGGVIITTITHALAVVRSHYSTIDLQVIGARFAGGTGATEH